MAVVTAVLLETMSIQKYVYAGNRLAENIGASNVISNIYRQRLKASIEKVLCREVDIEQWRANPDEIIIEKPVTDFEVGYIGGGNALLFFNDPKKATGFVKDWSRTLLVEAPALNIAVAVKNDFKVDNFKQEFDTLFQQLKKNKSKYFPQTFLTKHGITADCPYSGMSAEVFYRDPDGEGKYISCISKAKLDQVDDFPFQHSNYTLTTQIDKLGQTEGRDHIAIVYIDGNSLGQQFQSCQTLPELRWLSISMDKAMEEVYQEFLTFLYSHMNYLTSEESGFKLRRQDGKTILPFRPLLMEGDDLTFITDGRLGLPFAKKYLELMSRKVLSSGHDLSAAAGVAITKSKYPFFRGYTLAEELCQSAKIVARENPGTSWLDFHVAYGGFSGSLDKIRQDKYTIKQGKLNFGPYLISNEEDKEKSIVHLINGIKDFVDIKKWPRNKVKDFRTVLTLGQQPTEEFFKKIEIKNKNVVPYAIPGYAYEGRGWIDQKTPYFDMIELMEFYPPYFLNQEGGASIAKI